MSCKRPVPIERLFADPPVAGRSLTGVVWHPNGSCFTYLEKVGEGEEAPSDLWRCDLVDHGRCRLLEGKALRPPGSEDSKPVSLAGYQWSPDAGTRGAGGWLLLADRGRAWRCEPESGQLTRLLEGIDEQVAPHFSPLGDRLAFVRAGNLCLLDLVTQVERALTDDGSKVILNGRLDWVYWEELGHRERWRAFEWSPDGAWIAFLRLDQERVPSYPLVDAMAIRPKLTRQRYPKAGDPNSLPSLHVVPTGEKGLRRSATLPEGDGYIVPEITWLPDSSGVAWSWLSRDQRSVELRKLPTGEAEERLLLRETDPHWVNRLGPPLFLPDGRFLWISEATGRAHLTLHAAGGERLQALTEGDWQVERLHGLHDGHVHFTGTGTDARDRHLYRVPVAGGPLERLTPDGGVHTTDGPWRWRQGRGGARAQGSRRAGGQGRRGAGGQGRSGPEIPSPLLPCAPAPLPPLRHLLITRNSPESPSDTWLCDAAGGRLAVVREPAPEWREYAWAESEFVDLRATDGTLLHGRLIRPAEFDPSQRYPVVAHVYGGPHAQVVQKSWAGADALDQLLVQAGILVWRLDNRGGWGRGHAFEVPVDRELGRTELADQLAGVEYLRSLPYVDAERIGITGWSYGGFLTLYALTNAPDVWRCGVAGAPVTQWRLYDSIYTERYMGTPGENPEGYRAASPLEAAEALRAPLLLVHGTDDDNVHLQHTLQFVEALSRHRKPYELLLQPKQKHGFTGAAARTYTHERMVEFLTRHLCAPAPECGGCG